MKNDKQEIILYQTEDGRTKLDVKFSGDTLWLTQAQLAELFWRDRSVITKHILNIFEESEVYKESNVQNLHIANSDKPVAFYSLAVILANAIEPWEFMLNPNKNNEGIKNVHRLFAPMEYNENICIVKINVKEMVNPADGNRVYSIQTLDVFLKD